MDQRLKQARRALASLPSKQEYLRLMETAKLTPLERQVCDLKYLGGHSLSYIADTIGYSESWIKVIHHNVLRKLCRLFPL